MLLCILSKLKHSYWLQHTFLLIGSTLLEKRSLHWRLWEIYISCKWFAKSSLQKFAQVEYSLNMGLFETAISQYWQRLTLWFLHLQSLQSPNGAESEIFRKKLSAFHFKVVFKWKTFQSFFCQGLPLEYWRLTRWSTPFSYIFFIISNIQQEKDPAVFVYQDLLWACSVECFHAKMFRCKAINFWSEFSPSAGWARLLEKVKLWGKAHRQMVSF